MILSLLQFLACSFLIYQFGDFLLRKTASLDSKRTTLRLALNLITGLSLIIFLSHCLSFITQDYKLSVKISFILLFLIYLLDNLKKISNLSISRLCIKDLLKDKLLSLNIFKKQNLELIVLFFALALATCMGLKESFFGNPDRIHMPLIAGLISNKVYPPVASVSKDLPLDFYHYGTDLVGGLIMTLSGLDIWYSLSLQIALGVFLTTLLIFNLINKFIKSEKYSLVILPIIMFFTSINSFDFFIHEISKISHYTTLIHFLSNWLLASWTSVSHLSSQLRLPGQNFGIPLALSLIWLLINLKNNKIISHIILFLISFLLYFLYPTYWYCIIAAFVIISGFDVLILLKDSLKNKVSKRNTVKENIKGDNISNTSFISDSSLQNIIIGSFAKDKSLLIKNFLILVSLWIGKALTFTGGHSEINGINLIEFNPRLNWIHWGKAYINYFYKIDYLKSLELSYDPLGNIYHLQIPLFSSISFREFGALFLSATILYLLTTQSSNEKKSYLFLISTSLISFCVPFLFTLVLRPVDTSRFFFWANLIFLIFSVLIFSKYIFLQKFKSKLVRFIILFIVLVTSIPGFISYLPIEEFIIVGNKSLSNSEKELVKSLNKIHRSGDIALDSRNLDEVVDFSGLAGFYGVGGKCFFKYNLQTRLTAIYLINPILLQELNVKYIILDQSAPVSQIGLNRLKNPSLFKLIKYDNKIPIVIYEFIGHNKNFDMAEIQNYKKEYTWAFTIPTKEGDQILFDEKGDNLYFKDYQEAKKSIEFYRNKLSNQNKVQAAFLAEEAIIKN